MRELKVEQINIKITFVNLLIIGIRKKEQRKDLPTYDKIEVISECRHHKESMATCSFSLVYCLSSLAQVLESFFGQKNF